MKTDTQRVPGWPVVSRSVVTLEMGEESLYRLWE